MTSKYTWLRRLSLFAVVALLVAACGGAESADTTEAIEETPTTEAETPETTEAMDDETTTSAEEPTETTEAPSTGDAVTIAAAESITATFLPKCTNIPVFPQANEGAIEAAAATYADIENRQLIQTVVDLIRANYRVMIDELVRRGKLGKA